MSTSSILLPPDRLFPIEPKARALARALHDTVKALPIVSPHGHTDPNWFADDLPFSNPAELFVIPDHYIFRMLYSQGVKLESLGIARLDGAPVERDPRAIWRIFASHWYLFRGTPTRLWLDHAFGTLFGIDEILSAANADRLYDRIADCLGRPEFRPRALFERFKIEVIATTESPLDPLAAHQRIRASGWGGRVITTYRPDPVLDPDFNNFRENVEAFGALTGCDIGSFSGYLEAHRVRRATFRSFGATATDHGHPTARTADLSRAEAGALYQRVLKGSSAEDAELFRAQMLTEMAGMSLEDGMVMQIHAGSSRNHNRPLFEAFGRDKGCDIPLPTDYVRALQPLLSRYGNEAALTIILFTLDETVYSRELAPLAGHYPCLKLGPAWWFHDSAEGMRRFREMTTETAGFYNTVGFNDDTRAFPSIPARHDVARRVDCAFLAEQVLTHRFTETEAFDLAQDLSYRLAKSAYRL